MRRVTAILILRDFLNIDLVMLYKEHSTQVAQRIISLHCSTGNYMSKRRSNCLEFGGANRIDIDVMPLAKTVCTLGCSVQSIVIFMRRAFTFSIIVLTILDINTLLIRPIIPTAICIFR